MKNLLALIKILCVLFLVIAGFYFGMVSQIDTSPAIPPDTTYVYIDVPGETITLPGEIVYLDRWDTVYYEYAEDFDSLAHIDTTFSDSSQLSVDYLFYTNMFRIFWNPAPVQIKEITVIEYRTKQLRWYDGIGFGFGYDLIGKTATINIGYSINVGNLRGI